MEEIYKQNINELYENSHEVFQAVYQLAEIQIQNELMQEIQEVSKKIVEAAQKNNAVPVFIGRSPIAFAAYIKKYYEDMQAITIPLSGVSFMNTETITETELNRISAYLNKYLLEITKSKNILIVDYTDSGDSFNKFKLIISMCPYQNRTFYCAIYSPYSLFFREKCFKLKLQHGDTILKISDNTESPLANAINISSFDNLAPYNRYTLTQIINGEPEPLQSTDGFDLLTEML
jgi:hypoxanthine phosphoribosyltransferase